MKLLLYMRASQLQGLTAILHLVGIYLTENDIQEDLSQTAKV